MRRRILLGFGTLTIFVLLVLEIPLGLTYANRQRDQLSTELQRDAFFIASITEDRLEVDRSTGLQTTIDRYEHRYGPRVVVVDRAGRVVADSDPLPDADSTMRSRPEIGRALRGKVATGRRYSSTLHTDLLYVAVPVASGGKVHGAVRLTYPTSVLDRRVHRYWWNLAGVGAISLFGAMLLGALLARSATKPLRRVEEATTRFGAGSLDGRAPVTGPAEVRAMAETFNGMADRLAGLIDAQEAFVANASHQLRTPLTALRLRLENLQSEASGEAAEDADAALDELARMGRLVDGLLALARADSAAGVAPTAAVDIDVLLADRRAAWDPVAAERGIQIVAEPARDHDGVALHALATADRIDQALDNLITNALDASPDGAEVRLRAEAHGREVTIHVVDSGRGLSEEDRRRAFDRFWRAGTGPGRLGGSGLGLPIVRTLVAADGGHVELRPSPAGGVDAVITLHSTTR
ncbi:MAG: hypothetical protein JWM89_3761 [Acidimicrobiales bacterium]|nr:hypothetical protein [Acidimicrobiales bacterium]